MDFLAFIPSQDIIFRLGLLILIALYGLFALILLIQMKNLNRAMTIIGVAPLLNFAALTHLLATLALLIFAVVSL
jgi:hypothetical protein